MPKWSKDATRRRVQQYIKDKKTDVNIQHMAWAMEKEPTLFIELSKLGNVYPHKDHATCWATVVPWLDPADYPGATTATSAKLPKELRDQVKKLQKPRSKKPTSHPSTSERGLQKYDENDRESDDENEEPEMEPPYKPDLRPRPKHNWLSDFGHIDKDFALPAQQHNGKDQRSTDSKWCKHKRSHSPAPSLASSASKRLRGETSNVGKPNLELAAAFGIMVEEDQPTPSKESLKEGEVPIGRLRQDAFPERLVVATLDLSGGLKVYPVNFSITYQEIYDADEHQSFWKTRDARLVLSTEDFNKCVVAMESLRTLHAVKSYVLQTIRKKWPAQWKCSGWIDGDDLEQNRWIGRTMIGIPSLKRVEGSGIGTQSLSCGMAQIAGFIENVEKLAVKTQKVKDLIQSTNKDKGGIVNLTVSALLQLNTFTADYMIDHMKIRVCPERDFKYPWNLDETQLKEVGIIKLTENRWGWTETTDSLNDLKKQCDGNQQQIMTTQPVVGLSEAHEADVRVAAGPSSRIETEADGNTNDTTGSEINTSERTISDEANLRSREYNTIPPTLTPTTAPEE